MHSDFAFVLRHLIQGNKVAALGTLHAGKPFVSMVPFAIAGDGALVIHVSKLASHTRDMLKNPEVSMLIAEPESSEKMAQALARVTVQGRARVRERDHKSYAEARATYARRFPDAAPLFDFSDFKLFVIRPLSARLIAGFGQAVTIDAAEFKSGVCA